jgi:hypothetical protein
MPIQHAPTITWGTTSRLFLIHARDAADPSKGKTGLRSDGPGASGAYVREGERATAIALRPGRHGAWSPGALVEVDPEFMPGVYQIGLPDELFARGSSHAVVVLRFDGAVVDPLDVELVAYDPQEPYSIGIQELANVHRHAFLHGAMPGLTEDTLAAGEDAGRRLTRTLRAERPSDPAAQGPGEG